MAEQAKVSLDLDTKKAKKSAGSFWTKFAQLSRASAAQANSARASLGARQIGGGLFATAAGTLAAPIVGEASAAAFGFLQRAGTAIGFRSGIQPLLTQFRAQNQAFEQLRPIAEAQALASGGIDKESLLKLNEIFVDLEKRRSAGRQELATIVTEDKSETIKDILKTIADASREAVAVFKELRDRFAG